MNIFQLINQIDLNQNHLPQQFNLRKIIKLLVISILIPKTFLADSVIAADFGDTPTRYNNGNNGGHTNTSSPELYLGTVPPDDEAAPQNSTNALGDDNQGDDEDGITSFPTLNTSTNTYSLTVTLNNSSSSAANVYGWIDFDRDGEFDRDERGTVTSGTVTLDTDDKVPAGTNGTVMLNWSDIGDPGANIINGTSYVRVRTTTDNLGTGGNLTRRDNASVNTASDGEIEDYSLTIDYSAIAEISYCESLGGTLNTTNLFTEVNNGTFGTGTGEDESSSIDPALTTYTYDPNYPPQDGEYTVSTLRTTVGFNTWHTMGGHTTGDATDRFMVINANDEQVDTEMIQSRFITGLTPHTNYTFTAYILNTVEVNSSHIDPNVSYGIDLQGIDDDLDGIIDEDKEIEIRFSTGDIPESSQPTWVPYSFLFNTGDSTAARFIIRNNKIGGYGNDLAIDDITLRGCNLTTGNLEGTLYYDTNSNSSFDSGEPGLPPGLTVRLIDDRGTASPDDDVIITRLANPGGTFSFLNIPVGSNYRLEAPADDGSGNTISTTNPLTNVTVSANTTTANLNFGYQGVGDDYGDAPIDYDDTADNDVIDGGDNPARHAISTNLYLGNVAADADTPPLNSTDANQDDTSVAIDDEDAFASMPEVPVTGNYDLTVGVHNTSSVNATLHAWIDFDRDGKFESGEYQAAPVNINTSSVNLSWTVPSGLNLDDTTYARFRLTSDSLTDDGSTTDLDERSVGHADDGEIEDYQVAVESSVSNFAGQLVINEVLYAQTPSGTIGADQNDEFIELYNASNSSIDLSGFKLIDGNLLVDYVDDNGALDGTTGSITGTQNPYIFPSGTVLQSGEYAVIWIGDQNNSSGSQNSDRFADSAAFQAWLGSSPKLNNDGDDVWLYDADTKIIDYMAYGLESSGAINTRPTSNIWNQTRENRLDDVNNGQSISLTPNGADSNTSICWEATTSEDADSNPRCPTYLLTIDTDNISGRITSVGQNNNAARLLLVKRITDISPNRNGVDFNSFVDDGIANNEDNAAKWPTNTNTYLRGQIEGLQVLPGDEVEYTIYFLSNGGVPAEAVKLCDVIPDRTTFVEDTYGTELGIGLGLSSSSLPTVANIQLSNALNDDQGDFYTPGTSPPSFCQKHDPQPPHNLIPVNASNNNAGAIVVELDDSLPHATNPGTPSNAYGFVRFRVQVE